MQNEDVPLFIDGNKFFGKHIAVVGSTGSGKSCTVARILQNAVGMVDDRNVNKLDSEKFSLKMFA
jgi:DNA helicase HerA-like ATPase